MAPGFHQPVCLLSVLERGRTASMTGPILPDPTSGHTCSRTAATMAAFSSTVRVLRRARRRRVQALSLEQVGPVQPGSRDVDDDLAGSRSRIGDFDDP